MATKHEPPDYAAIIAASRAAQDLPKEIDLAKVREVLKRPAERLHAEREKNGSTGH